MITKMEEERQNEEDIKQARQHQKEQQLWSWGAGTDGQLATGKLQDEHLPQLVDLRFLSSSLGPISSVACGGAHVIAFTSCGKVFSWGRGSSGQLGHGNQLTSLHPKLVTFFDDCVITHVSAGWSHSGFVSDKGCVFTCGDGSFGQLGHGDYKSHAVPVPVSYFGNRLVQQIACGMRHSLVLLKDSSGNQVYGFGSGKRGQLGISVDQVKSINLPRVTCGLEDCEINGINANGDHSAALSADGHLYTWGRGFSGFSDVFRPQRLVSPLQFVKVALGWSHALALAVEGGVFILGGERHGALGDLEKQTTSKNLADSTNVVLRIVSSLQGVKVVDIAAGSEHSTLLTEDGVIKTWGWGEHGQLGLGSTSDQIDPQPVGLGDKPDNQEIISGVYCGSGFTFVLRSLSSSKPACISS